MHRHLVLMRILHHPGQHDVAFLRLLIDQHVIVRANAIRVLSNLLHRARFKHPVIVVVNPTAVRFFLLGFIPVGIGNQLHQVEVHPHFGFQLILDALEFGHIKTLQIDLILFVAVAVLFQHFQRLRSNVLPFLVMEPRRFNFRIDTDVLTGGMI
ncbi:hypothetical protein D3C73_1066340 [compost metagenome]